MIYNHSLCYYLETLWLRSVKGVSFLLTNETGAFIKMW